MHIDTRKEDISVDYLLRGIQHRIRNNKGLSNIYLENVDSLEDISSLDEFETYDNISLSPELYFNLDYASKLYDPRSVPGNTRFYKIKKLIMRVFRLYATRQVEFNAAILKITNRFFDLFHDIAEKFEYFRKSEVRIHKRIEQSEKLSRNINRRLDVQQSRLEYVEDFDVDISFLRRRLENVESYEQEKYLLRKRIEKLEEWDKDFSIQRSRIEKLENWDKDFSIQRDRIEKLENWDKDFNIQRKRFEELEKTNRTLSKRLLPLENLKERFEILLNENTVLRQRLENLIVETKNVSKISRVDKNVPTEINGNISNDYLYFPYINADRAIESVVKKLIEPYVSFFSKSTTDKKISNPFVIDIGCGRGEFLDICREASVPAKGLDINEDMVNHCKTKKHDVILSDAVSYLKSLENGSLKGIFACHIIEHLHPNQLLEFLRLCSAKLAHGGKLALETPNPTSFFALSMFYRDFTHKQPIHPNTMSFLLEKLSFQNVKVKEIHPTPEKYKLKTDSDNNLLENTNIEKLNNTLYGYLDYSVLATK
ncbi:MAG: hypothetical protein DRI44_01270 [Chlamydiae bacterium]|nr:MAG: hypothetical protein DRI44_01270 [Chlamydiota bacterium]